MKNWTIFMQVLPINTFEVEPWILRRHYAKRMPSISYAFGLYEDGLLTGICTFGMPASPFLCMGVCGKENKDKVIELNRLCVDSKTKNASSFLVGRSLKMLPKPMIVVSYADTAQNHVGYIYQACNFLFTGTTKERTDMAGNEGQHSRHNKGDRTNRINRSAKHRYIFFVGNKTEKKKFREQLMYPVIDFPKGNTKRYNADAEIPIQQMLF
jgi:hypothetical protein